MSQLLGKLRPPLILIDPAWIPKFRQTCYPPESNSGAGASHHPLTPTTTTPNSRPSATPPPQPTSWQHHLSSAPPHSFTDSFADLLTSRPSLVFFGEQHHQPHVIRSQVQLLAALADQRDQLDKESSQQRSQESGLKREQIPSSKQRTVQHHLHLLLEHFSYADQPLLDRFHAGTLSISELCTAYRERSDEGFTMEMYAPLLLLARERGATIWGGFPPRTWARQMVKEGVDKVQILETQRTDAVSKSRGSQTLPQREKDATIDESQAQRVQSLPFLLPMDSLAIPPFVAWERVRQLSSSHRTFLSSLMRPDGPPRFPSTALTSNVPLGAISALHLYPTQDLQGPKEEIKGFSPAQALKDSYLAHAASSLVKEGHLLAGRAGTIGDARINEEVEHRNIVLVVAGLGHVEAGFGAPERLAEGLQSIAGRDASTGGQRPLIILSKPKDSSLWLGPEWVNPTSTSSSSSHPEVEASTQGAKRAAVTPAITREWLQEQILSPSGGQVAGHAGAVGTLNGPDGEALVAKKSIASEARFYEELNAQRRLKGEDEGTAAKRKLFATKFTPEFYGAFPLSPQAPDQSKTSGKEEVSVVCEDLLAPYRRPNVMDIKLGTQLWDDDATQEKRDRMDQVSKETTSGRTGVRLTGWRTWDPIREEYYVVSKAFGKSIKVDQLSLGMRAFFGQLQTDSGSSRPDVSSATSAQQDQRAAFQKIMEDCGLSATEDPSLGSSKGQAGQESVSRGSAPQEAASDAPTSSAISTSRTPTLSSHLVQRLISSHLLPPLVELTIALSELNTRMRGASLLVVWEGEVQRLEELLKAAAEGQGSSGASPSELDSSSSSSSSAPPPPPLSVHLIDFAHSRFLPASSTPSPPLASASATASASPPPSSPTSTSSRAENEENGPDTGVLLGLKTVRRLLEEMIGGESQDEGSRGCSPAAGDDTNTNTNANAKATATATASLNNRPTDSGWDRKLADALVLYDWIDLDEGAQRGGELGGTMEASVGGARE